MATLRDESEALAEALEMGLCDVAEVIAWSDAQLLREEAPPISLCEVSMAHDRYPQDVAALLRQSPGVPVQANVTGLLVALLNNKLKREPDRARRIASVLYTMALSDEIEDPDLKQVARWAWDAFDLADAGQIEESPEQVADELAVTLDRAATRAPIAWSVEIGPPGTI
jgi:hypothetical protein